MNEQIVDQLGRIIEYTGDAEDYLKAIKSQVAAAVGKAAQFHKESDDHFKDLRKKLSILEKIASENEKHHNKLEKFNDKLPENLRKELEKPLNELHDTVKDIKSALEDIAKSRKGAGTNDMKSGLAGLEKMLQGIQKSLNNATKPLEQMNKSAHDGHSLDTHDHRVERLLITISKNIEEMARHMTRNTRRKDLLMATPGTSTMEERGRRPRGTGTPTAPAVKTTSGVEQHLENTGMEEGAKEATEAVGKLNQIMRNTRRGLRGVVADLRDLSYYSYDVLLPNDELTADFYKQEKEVEKILAGISELGQELYKMRPRMQHIVAEEVKHARAILTSGKNIEVVQEELKNVLLRLDHIHKKTQVWKTLLAESSKIAFNLVGIIGGGALARKIFEPVFGGVVKDAVKWSEDTAEISHTLSDIANDAEGIRGTYRDVAREGSIVAETGQRFADVQKEIVKSLKQGSRNLSETNKVMRKAAALAYQLGTSVEATADEMHKWHMHIGLSSTDMTRFTRSIRLASMQTGVMGENMLRAVEAAREIAKEMRNAGLHSVDAAQAFVRAMAEANKNDIAGPMQEFLKAASQGLDGFNKASAGMKNFLAMANQLGDVFSGKALSSPENARKTQMRQAQMIEQFLRANQAGAAINQETGEIDLSQLSEDLRSQLNMVTKSMWNMGLGELAVMHKSLRAASRTAEEELNNLENQLANPNLTKAERQALLLRQREVKQLKIRETVEKRLNKVLKVSQMAMKKGFTAGDLKKTLSKEFGVAAENVQDEFDQMAKDVNERLKSVGMGSLEDELKKMGLDLSTALQNPKNYREVTDAIQTLMQKADTQNKASRTALSRKDLKDKMANEKLEKWLGPAVEKVLDSMDENLIYLIGILAVLWSIKSIFSTTGKYMKSLTNKALTPGSIYTHDTHLEKLMQQELAEQKRIFKPYARQPGERKANKERLKDPDVLAKLAAVQAKTDKLAAKAGKKVPGGRAARMDEGFFFDKLPRFLKLNLAKKVTVSFLGWFKEIGSALSKLMTPFRFILPALKSFGNLLKQGASRIFDFASRGWVKFQDFWQKYMPGIMERARGMMKKTWNITLRVLNADLRKMKSLVVGGFKKMRDGIITQLSKSKIGQGILAVGGKLGSMGKGIGPLVGQLGKFGAIAAAVAGALGIVVGLFSALLGENEEFMEIIKPLMEVFNELKKVLTEVLLGVIKGITKALVPIMKALTPVLTGLVQALGKVLMALVPVVEVLFSLVGAILEPILTILNPIVEVIGIFIAELATLLRDLIVPLADLLKDILVPIMKVFVPIVQLLGSVLKLVFNIFKPFIVALQLFAKLLQATLVPVLNIVVGVINLVVGAINTMIGWFDKVINIAANFMKSLWNAMIEPFTKIPVVGKYIKKLQFEMHEGGIVPKSSDAKKNGLKPDETPIVAKAGEVVLTEKQAAQVEKAMDSRGGTAGGGLSQDNPLNSIKEGIGKMVGMFTGIGMPHMNLNAGIFRGFRESSEKAFEGPTDTLKKPMETMIDPKKGVGAQVGQTVSKSVENLGNSEAGSNKVVGAVDTARDAIVNAIKSMPQAPRMHTGGIVPRGNVSPGETPIIARPGEIVVPVDAVQAAQRAATTGREPLATARPQERGEAATRVDSTEASQRVRRQVQESQQSPEMRATNEELVQISANTKRAADTLEEVYDVLGDIKTLLQPSNAGGRPVTAANVRPRGTVNDRRWGQGQVTDDASIGEVRMGR